MFKRYAIYFVPDGVWGDFGADWLGWDNRVGAALSSAAPELTKRPRKYGFHATIKPPFRLAEGATAQDLAAASARLSATQAPFTLTSLALRRIGRFVALTAPDEATQLRKVADTAVKELDMFRAPLNTAELERRRASRLSDAQEALLQKWGYPYVMDEFRFHLTLTGPLADADAAQPIVEDALRDVLQTPLVFDSLSLCGEAEDGSFHQVERFAFAH